MSYTSTSCIDYCTSINIQSSSLYDRTIKLMDLGRTIQLMDLGRTIQLMDLGRTIQLMDLGRTIQLMDALCTFQGEVQLYACACNVSLRIMINTCLFINSLINLVMSGTVHASPIPIYPPPPPKKKGGGGKNRDWTCWYKVLFLLDMIALIMSSYI